MSRVGKQPVVIPEGVQVTLKGKLLRVRGPLGELQRELRPGVRASIRDGNVVVERESDTRAHHALHGLARALIANMVHGVSVGYAKELEIHGVGYRATRQGNALVLELGYSHPVAFLPPDGVQLAVEGTTRITVKGIDKELVGQVAATIRSFRKPEPYKGKGIRYVGEHLRRKAGKTTG
jgi:large subunit ribosomal protein L6